MWFCALNIWLVHCSFFVVVFFFGIITLEIYLSNSFLSSFFHLICDLEELIFIVFLLLC